MELAVNIQERAAALMPTVHAVLKQAWMPGDWFRLSDSVVGHYAAKAAVCQLALAGVEGRRAKVLEIGTRCGYSAAVFRLVAPSHEMLCLDGATDDDSEQCLAWARGIFVRHEVNASLVVVDTRHVRSLPAADFAHVDGNHSAIGCLNDLRLCDGAATILADDADNPDVTRAVRQFVAETGRKVLFFDDGLRQAAVIQ